MEYSPTINSIHFQNHSIDILRLDLIHPLYGGNKYFKLKYNLQKAKNLNKLQILTFGGAHSNHIAGVAAVGKEQNLKTIGVIRGEESIILESPTLQIAEEMGMQLHFVSREKYNRKTEVEFEIELKSKFGDFYLIPEGGANYQGVQGCTEILTQELKSYDYVFCACGTAGTYSGIKISASRKQKVIGISVLKGKNELIKDANKWFKRFGSSFIDEDYSLEESTIINDYHFGGYAKFSQELVSFKNEFEKDNNIPLDYIYTSKLFFAVFDLIKQNKIKIDSKILIIHSGGIQGNAGFENRYQFKPIL